MDDLVQFLRDRLNEDEQIAREMRDLLSRLEWTAEHALRLQHAIARYVPEEDQSRIMRATTPEPDRLTWTEGEEMQGTVFDPTRALREVQAKRELLSRYEAMATDVLVVTGREAILSEYRRVVLPGLALPYADHPDYRPEWRP